MKILFLSAQYPPEAKGGGELSTHIIAQGLQKLGHAVHVVTSGLQKEETEVDGISVTVLPLGLKAKPLFEKVNSKKASRILLHHIPDLSTYDIVHAHDFRSALMVSELRLKHAVVTARDYAQISGCTNNIQADGNIDPGCQGAGELFRCHRIAEASLLRKPFRMWQYAYNLPYRKAAFASFTHQIFISNSQKELIAKYQNISHQHTAVIYNPISPEYLSEPLVKGEEGNILYLGRVEMYKGVLVLLRAFKEVMKTSQRAHLTIVGNGAQMEEYERLASTWGMQYQVTFTPHVPYHRLKSMINDAEILVVPHLWVEPFGRTVIEGMARGRVVIASNIGGPAEILNNAKTLLRSQSFGGQAGLLFERGSVRDLARTLEHALEMNHFDKKEIGIAARDYVRDHLNMEKIAKQHEEFYKEVASVPEKL